MEPVLAAEKLARVLNFSRLCLDAQYSDRPQLTPLADALDANIHFANFDCHESRRLPQDVLDGYIANERRTVAAWNQHRFGHATPRQLYEMGPERAVQVYQRTENISDDTENAFPIRAAATLHNVPFKQFGPLPQFRDPLATASCAWIIENRIPVHLLELYDIDQSELDAMATQMHSRPSQPAATPRPAPRPALRHARTSSDTPTITLNLNHSMKYNKLKTAPSPRLPFPRAPANITIAEITCFLPEWLKSPAVIDRAISNSGTAGVLATMINAFRETGVPGIESCTVLRMMQKPMRQRGPEFASWCIGRHEAPAGHDERSISVAGFTPYQDRNKRRQADHVMFRDLMQGVKMVPVGPDALDLTRCVTYCLQAEHVKENWYFPDHYHDLLARLGGPAEVTAEHWDRAMFDRWLPKRKRQMAESMFRRERNPRNGRLLGRRAEAVEEGDDMDGEVEQLNSDVDAVPRSAYYTRS